MCVDVNFKPWLSTYLLTGRLVAAEMIRTGPPERIGLSGMGPHQFLADTLILFQSRGGGACKLGPPNRIVPNNIF